MNIEELTLKQIREISALVNGTVQQLSQRAAHPFVGKYVIAELRGGIPENCDFCGKPFTEENYPLQKKLVSGPASNV